MTSKLILHLFKTYSLQSNNILRLFVVLLLLAITDACYGQNNIHISGRVLDPVSDSIVVSYNNNRIAYYPNDYFATIDKKGNFSMSFSVPVDMYTVASIRHGNRMAELILQPGDSLVVNAIGARFDSLIHYYGRGSEVQNFLAKHAQQHGLMNQYSIKIREQLHREPADFLKSIEQEKKEELDYADRFKAGLPASFLNYWTAFYTYYNYFFIQQYPQIHELLRLRRYTDTIPEINYSVVTEMPYVFNDSLLQVSPYLLYLTGVLDIKLKADGYSYYRADTMRMRMFEDSVNKIAFELMPNKSAEYFSAQNIYGRAKNQDIKRTEYQFKVFKKHWRKSEYLPQLQKQIDIAERLAPGQPAPDIAITTPDGKHMNLSDLKGKVVYLGFWANWCRQCVGEMVGEQKIKTLTKKDQVEFVYVSMNDDSTADNAIIKKYKIDGTFTHAVNGWDSKEVQLYGVQSLPAYFLIDKDGNFALQNPPTPMQSTELMLEMGKLVK